MRHSDILRQETGEIISSQELLNFSESFNPPGSTLRIENQFYKQSGRDANIHYPRARVWPKQTLCEKIAHARNFSPVTVSL